MFDRISDVLPPVPLALQLRLYTGSHWHTHSRPLACRSFWNCLIDPAAHILGVLQQPCECLIVDCQKKKKESFSGELGLTKQGLGHNRSLELNHVGVTEG